MINKDDNSFNKEPVNVNMLDLPFPLMRGGVHIELFGNSRLSFEGKYKIIEYTDYSLKVKISKQIMHISGNGLNISNVQNGTFLLAGKIISIEFEG